MSDGSIKIDIMVDDKPVSAASKELDKLEASGHKSGEGVKATEDGLKGVSEESTKAGSNIKKFATAIGLVAIAAGAFKVLRASMDDAISRFDTLNQFPRVMEQVGFSAEESERAINRLSDGIEGLPTKLDDVTSTAQQIAVMTGDLDGAVDTTLALNNAFLASGASTADAQRGLQQYVQMLSKGEVDLQSWRTLQETMGVALNDVALAFGFAGESAQNDLYAALQSGEITFKEFNAQLIKSSNETGGFADRAKTASTGIATSLQNLRTAVSRNLANIIERFDQLTQAVTGKDIAQNIDSLKGIIDASFRAIGNVIERTTPYVIGFANAVQATLPVVQALTPLILGLAAAYGTYVVISRASAAIQASNVVLQAAMASTQALTIATRAQTTATIANASAVKLSTLAIGVMTGTISASAAAKAVATTASYALGAAWRFLTGPIGWVVAGVGALTAATVAVVRWFNRASEESKQYAAEVEESAAATDELTNSLDNTSKAYQDQQKDIEAASRSNKDLADRIEELAEKENKSAGEKQMLKSYIEQLNGSIDDLNLAYDEEADALNMSSEQIAARVEVMQEEEKLLAARERQVEISQEQEEVEAQLAKTIAEKNEVENDSNLSKSEASELSEKLTEKERELEEALAALAEQQADTENQMTESQDKIAEAVESGNLRQITSYEQLEGKLKETFDSMKGAYEELEEAATDAFDKIETETEHTMESMTETMQHNQQAVAEWSENQAKLMEWAGENGYNNFIPYIESLGIDSAAELAVLADASEDELTEFANVLEQGSDVATEGLKTKLGEGFDEAVDVMVNFVDDGASTLREKIKDSKFDEIGQMVPEGYAKGVDDNADAASDATRKMAEDSTQEAKDALGMNSPSRVFREIGEGVPEGLALGITDGTSKVIQAIQKMFKAVETDSNNSFRSITKSYDDAVNQIDKSLAKLPEVTQKSMQNMLDRLRNGAQAQINMMRVLNMDYDRSIRQIETNLNRLPVIAHNSMSAMLSRTRTGATAQVAVMRALSSDILTPFNSTPVQFNRIGQNIMAGLNAGINARRGQVMSTVRGIANEITRTMQRAQRINSPGREMRDKVGKWIPAGIAEGIKNNAKSVYRELENLSSGMTMAVSPEQAAGVHRMAYSSGAAVFGGGIGKSSATKPAVNMDALITGIANRLSIQPSAVIMEGREVGKIVWEPVTEFQERNKSQRNKFK